MRVVVLAGLAAVAAPATAGAEAARKRRPVTVVETVVDGPLDSAAARSTVQKQAKRFDSCYPQKNQAHAKAARTAPGTVALRLFVEKTGRVVAATVERPLDQYSDVTRCLMRNAMNVRFRKASSHSTVRFSVRSARREYGILSLLRSAPPSGGVSNIFGGGSVGSGLFKSTGKIGRGTGGLGLRGTGGSGGLGTVGGSGGGGFRAAKAAVLNGRLPNGRVQTGTIAVRGSLSRDVIRRVVGRRMGALRQCYQVRLASNPSLTGTMTVNFIIGARGAVTSVSVNSVLDMGTMHQCVTGVFRGLTFPAPAGGGIVAVTYPLTVTTN